MFDDLDPDTSDDAFLLKEGLELLATYRKIQSATARAALLTMMVAIVEAEQAATRAAVLP